MSPEQLKRQAVEQLITAKRHNKAEFLNFFKALYEIESDPYAPAKVSEVFAGIDIPDVRQSEDELVNRYPHFFICNMDTSDPTFKDYQPDSELYKREFQELVSIVRAVRAKADIVNQEAMKLCDLQSKGVS